MRTLASVAAAATLFGAGSGAYASTVDLDGQSLTELSFDNSQTPYSTTPYVGGSSAEDLYAPGGTTPTGTFSSTASVLTINLVGGYTVPACSPGIECLTGPAFSIAGESITSVQVDSVSGIGGLSAGLFNTAATPIGVANGLGFINLEGLTLGSNAQITLEFNTTPTATPLPAAVWLLASALGVVGVGTRKRAA
jgi:hypothetical protein